jgi:hypothetical protein
VQGVGLAPIGDALAAFVEWIRSKRLRLDTVGSTTMIVANGLAQIFAAAQK